MRVAAPSAVLAVTATFHRSEPCAKPRSWSLADTTRVSSAGASRKLTVPMLSCLPRAGPQSIDDALHLLVRRGECSELGLA
jgi:hypothetical protein